MYGVNGGGLQVRKKRAERQRRQEGGSRVRARRVTAMESKRVEGRVSQQIEAGRGGRCYCDKMRKSKSLQPGCSDRQLSQDWSGGVS